MKIEEIKSIIKLMSENDLTEFKIESEEMTLCLRRSGREIVQVQQSPVYMPAPVAAAPIAPVAQPAAPAPAQAAPAAAASAETQDVLDAALHVLPTAFRLLREAFPASAKVAVMSGDRVILTDAEECGFDPESPALLCASVFGRSVPVAFAVYDSNFPPEASFLKVRRWNDSDEDAKPVVETIRKEPSWYMWNDLRAVERPLPDGNAPQRSAAKATMAQENSRRNADAP